MTSLPRVTCPSPAMTTLLSRRTQSTVVDRIFSRICSWNFILSHRSNVPVPHRGEQLEGATAAAACEDPDYFGGGPQEIRQRDRFPDMVGQETEKARPGRDRRKEELQQPQAEQAGGFPTRESHVHEEDGAQQRLTEGHQQFQLLFAVEGNGRNRTTAQRVSDRQHG